MRYLHCITIIINALTLVYRIPLPEWSCYFPKYKIEAVGLPYNICTYMFIFSKCFFKAKISADNSNICTSL